VGMGSEGVRKGGKGRKKEKKRRKERKSHVEPTNNKLLQVSLAPLLSIYKRQKLPLQRPCLLGYNTTIIRSTSYPTKPPFFITSKLKT